MAVTSAQQTAIANLYIALFNRAPDAGGLDFWANALANGVSFATVAQNFVASPEAKLIYPTAQTPEQFVSTFYLTVFGRAVDAAGLVFWTGVMNAAGGSSDAAKALLVSKIVDIVSTPLGIKPAGLSDAQYLETVKDRDLFSKKMAISIDFAVNQKNSDLSAAKLAFVGGNTPVTPDVPSAPEILVIRLTTGADTKTGSAGNDTFNGALDGGVATLSSIDTLDGGAGIDTLNAALLSSNSGTPRLTSIEIVNLSSPGTGGILDLNLATGVQQANIVGSTAVGYIYHVGTAALSVANQNATAGFSGSTGATLSLSLSTVGTAGTLTAVTLNANTTGAALATTYNITADNAYVTIAGAAPVARNVTVAATGVNALNLSSAANLNTLSVTGLGSVDFSSGALAALTTFTAGDGGVKLTSIGVGALTITTGSGVDTIVANGASITSLNVGAGNDVVTLGTAALSASATVNLGAGDDTLILTVAPTVGATISGGADRDTLQLNNSALDYAAISTQVTGFEVLALGATGFTVDRSQTGLINSFAVANAGTTTFTNADSASTFAIDNSAGVTAVNVANSAAGSTHITLTNNAATPAANAIGTLNVSGATQIFLTSSGTSTNSNVITNLIHPNISTITVQGTADLSFGISGAATGTTVDATAFTGKLTVRGSIWNDVITGGAGDDNITGGSGADTLTGGSGNDIFSFDSRGATQGVGFGGSNTTAANIEKITDFSGNGTLAGDRISFGIGGDAFGTGLNFAVTTVALVSAVTVASAGNFAALALAIETARPGAASSSAIVRVYDVTVTGGSLAGRYLVLNDQADAISASNDTFISITGITGALNDQDFVFG